MEPSDRFNENYGRILLLWCNAFLLIFVTGFFFLGTSKQLNNLFYIALCLPALALLAMHRKHLFKNPLFFVLFFVLAGWMVFTSLVMTDPPVAALADLKPLLYVFFLAILIFLVFERYPDFPVMMCWAILIVATITGLYRIHQFYSPDWIFGRRLLGSGVLSNSIWIGAAYGLATLVSIIMYLREERAIVQVALVLLGATPLAVMLLAQSRGPYVALAFSVIYSVIAFRNRRAMILGAMIVLVVIFSLVIFPYLLDESRLIKGGDSYRFAIWGNAVDAIAESLFFGYGVAQDSQNSVGKNTFDHFHSVYLTLVFHSGIVGFLLFLPLVLRPFLIRKQPHWLLLKPMLIFGMTYMLFNASRLFTSPKELWLIFWVPLLLLWAGDRRLSQGTRNNE